RLRERVMERVLHMRADHVERVRIGDLLSRVGDDVAVVTNAIARNGPEVVTALAVVLLTPRVCPRWTGDWGWPGWWPCPSTSEHCFGICPGRGLTTRVNVLPWGSVHTL